MSFSSSSTARRISSVTTRSAERASYVGKRGGGREEGVHKRERERGYLGGREGKSEGGRERVRGDGMEGESAHWKVAH